VTAVWFYCDHQGPCAVRRKTRDYYDHVRAMPFLRAELVASAGALWTSDNPWRDRRAFARGAFDVAAGDALFLADRDWEAVPSSAFATAGAVFALIEDPGHAAASDARRDHLQRYATRLATSGAAADAVRPLANGPLRLHPHAIDLDFWRPMTRERDRTTQIGVFAAADPERGAALAAALERRGARPLLHSRAMSPEATRRAVAACRTVVTTPPRTGAPDEMALRAMAMDVACWRAGAGPADSPETAARATSGSPEDAADEILAFVRSGNAARAEIRRRARAAMLRRGLDRERALFQGALLDLLKTDEAVCG